MSVFEICATGWLVGLLACCSVLHIWFTTTIGVEIAIFCRDVLKARCLAGEKFEEMSRQDFSVWLIAADLRGNLPRRFVHILGCPGCLSVHTSLVLTFLTWVFLRRFLGTEVNVHDAVTFMLVCIVTWPWLACRLTSRS